MAGFLPYFTCFLGVIFGFALGLIVGFKLGIDTILDKFKTFVSENSDEK